MYREGERKREQEGRAEGAAWQYTFLQHYTTGERILAYWSIMVSCQVSNAIGCLKKLQVYLVKCNGFASGGLWVVTKVQCIVLTCAYCVWRRALRPSWWRIVTRVVQCKAMYSMFSCVWSIAVLHCQGRIETRVYTVQSAKHYNASCVLLCLVQCRDRFWKSEVQRILL